ncbi:MAG: Fic-DOC domain mobile mystery protein B [Phenylobacterium sp.]|jgi:Fic-DOC domain mobile mystery protein B
MAKSKLTAELIDGATPLDPDEMAGLKFKHITVRQQLDELEQANIVQGMLWLKKHNRQNYLTIDFTLALHKALFGQVWQWAGSFRTTEKNIGIDPLHICVALRNLLDDVTVWAQYNSYPPQEAILRFHHKLVQIHPFPNGNGRFSRIFADLIAQQVFQCRTVQWGGRALDKVSQVRMDYIKALRQADAGDLEPLMLLYSDELK